MNCDVTFQLRHSEVSNNFGNGVSTRTSFFAVEHCHLLGNHQAGFDYNPMKQQEDGLQVRSGIIDPIVFEVLSGNQAGTGSQNIVNEGFVTMKEQHF